MKFEKIDLEEQNVIKGLETIKSAGLQIEQLQNIIKEQQESVMKLMQGIKIKADMIKEETDKAKKKEAEVLSDKTEIEKNKVIVFREKGIAEEKLAASKPVLEEAMAALGKIQPKELDELAKTQPDKQFMAIKYCFDCVGMLMYVPVRPVELVVDVEVKRGVKVNFYKDSYDLTLKSLLKNTQKLLAGMKEFGDKKDKVNDEAIELVEAYLFQEWFN